MARQRHPSPRHLVVVGAAAGMGRWLWDNVFRTAEWESVCLVDTPEAAAGLSDATQGYAASLTCALVVDGRVVDADSGEPVALGADLTTVCFAVTLADVGVDADGDVDDPTGGHLAVEAEQRLDGARHEAR